MNRRQLREALARVIFEAGKPYKEGHWQGDWDRMRKGDKNFWLIKADAVLDFLGFSEVVPKGLPKKAA